MEPRDDKQEPNSPPEKPNGGDAFSSTPTSAGNPGHDSDLAAEVEALRAELKKNRREVTIVKTMLYFSVALILVVTFYIINKTQVLHLKDLGTQLTLSQNQAALNLGVIQKTLEQRIDKLETRLQQVAESAETFERVNHPGQLNRMEETVTGLTGSLSLLKTEDPAVQVKVDRVRQNAGEMVETYKQSIRISGP